MNTKENYQKRYQKLNPEQKLAVETIDGSVMVVAGPGMGKTELLALRVANILQQTDTPSESILCLTFTDSAAQNMLERLVDLIGKEAYNVAIHTFHSFATEVINHNQEFFWSGAKFKTADNLAQTKILTEIIDNLPAQSPLVSPGKDFKHNHIRKIKQAISNIKKEGFTPEELNEILLENQNIIVKFNPILNTFFSNPLRKTTDKLDFVSKFPDFLNQIITLDNSFPESKYHNRGIKKISTIVLNQLKDLQDTLQNQTKINTKPITKFKNNNLIKDSQNQYILQDTKSLETNLELAKVYSDYKNNLYSQGLFDFDDMLIEVNKSLQKNPELSYNYKEKYLYILVDEFQDTNLSQSQLLDNIIDLEITNNNPNIMVVGDDDQAIYKFQGANIDNILNFQEKYPKTKFITLHKNYRSHQKILNLAKEVIQDCKLRLSDKIDIDKNLTAVNEDTIAELPEVSSHRTRLESLNTLAKTIASDIKKGIEPNQIAVLVKKHKQLEDFIKILNYYKIPVKYEKSSNVLDIKYIQEIITLIQYINSINNTNTPVEDHLINKIITFEMFSIDNFSIYKISQKAYNSKIQWLDAIYEYSTENHHDNKKLKDLHEYLLNLAKEAQTDSVEVILDKILGSYQDNTPINQYQDELDNIDQLEQKNSPKFSLKEVISTKPDYLIFLSGLKAFIDNLRKYKANETIYTQDFVDYIKLLEENQIPVNDNSPYSEQENAIELMTVYKAKGLEFENVYVLDCNNNYWNSKKTGNSIKLPKNTPFSPQTDNTDDFIRLFFVAITRAKNQLKLFRYNINDQEKKTNELEFLVDRESVQTKASNPQNTEELTEELNVWLAGDIQKRVLSIDEKQWLKPFFNTYKLSATNLFNFLDVTSGGPKFFLERNILRFPQAKNPSASYGTAMHETISKNYINFLQNNQLPKEQSLIDVFSQSLIGHRLSNQDYKKMLYKGQQALPVFYNQIFSKYTQDMKVEINFRGQNVNLQAVPITGSIDQMVFDKSNKTIKVIDLKTGASSQNWKGKDEYAKKKLINYKLQLVFYKLLVENSRDFRGYTVNTGSLMFMEPKPGTNEITELVTKISHEEADKVNKLIQIVYKKITNFDYPDTSNYQQSYKGINNFIEDLLSGKI